MRIKVVVPVSTDIWNEMIEEAYNKYKDPDTKITIVNIKKGPESIEMIYDEVWAELEALLEAEKAEKEGYDAVIDYCFGDPGLIAIKEALDIPVVGLCEPSIHIASTLGRKFSIVSVGGAKAKGMVLEKIKSYGLEHKLASIRLTEIKVLDIKKDFNKLVEALYEEAKKAVEEDGADVIVLGCGSLLNIAEILQKRLGVPVIDPGLAALKYTEMLVKLGLKHSKKAYPKPYEKKRTA